MVRPEAERLFVQYARRRGYLGVVGACELVDSLARRGETGLQAARDRAVRLGLLTEKQAYRVYRDVSDLLRELENEHVRIQGYEILGELGRGSMGVVYRARRLGLDRLVALKVLPPRLGRDGVFLERFLREARAAARCNHPNVVSALDAGRSGELHYIAFELVDGCTIKEICEVNGPLGEREALKVAWSIAQALDHIHGLGLVHRDVKPSNFMVSREGRIKLTDLGLVHIEDEEDLQLTQHGRSVGTPYYMSPEQALERRSVDPRSDLYALGASLYYMLVGRAPYQGATPSAVLAQHVKAPVPDPRAVRADISRATAELCRSLMAKQPAKRPQSAAVLVDRLERLLAPGASRRTTERRAAVPVEPSPTRTEKPTRSGRARVSRTRLDPLSSDTVRRLRGVRRRSARTRVVRSNGGRSAALAFSILGLVLLLGVGFVLAAQRARTDLHGASETETSDRSRQADAERVAETPLAEVEAYERNLERHHALYGLPEPSTGDETDAGEGDFVATRALGSEADRLAAAVRARERERERAEAHARARAVRRRYRQAISDAFRSLQTGGALAQACDRLHAAFRSLAPDDPRRETLSALIVGLLELERLDQIAARALAARVGAKIEVRLRGRARLEGKIARVERTDLSLELPAGGQALVPLATLTEDELIRLALGPLGNREPELAAARAMHALIAGDFERALRFAERGGAKGERLLAALRTLKSDAQLGPMLAERTRRTEPSRKSSVNHRRSATSKSRSVVEQEPRELVIGTHTLLRLFETQPLSFTARGDVRFHYRFLDGLKRLGRDFSVHGSAPRFDARRRAMVLGTAAGAARHRAAFTTGLRFELELEFEQEPAAGSFLALILEERRTARRFEAPFGLALMDISGRSRKTTASGHAVRFARNTPYRFTIEVLEDGVIVAELDGQVQAHLATGVQDGQWRLGFRWQGVKAKLRALRIEGRLEPSWVAQSLGIEAQER